MNKKLIRYALIGIVVVLVYVGISSCNKSNIPSLNYPDAEVVQMQEPQEGQEIAIIKTTLGDIRVILYREYAPNTVEHFVSLANKGYYDGKYIFSVENGGYFLAGTYQSDGLIVKNPDNLDEFKDLENKEENDSYTKQKNIYDTEMTRFDNEIHQNLWPIKGAFISLGPDLKGSGTFFGCLGSIEFTDDIKNEMQKQEGANQDIVNAFLEKGGIPAFSQAYTIFAQIYDDESMKVFDKIGEVDVKGDNKQPVDDIKIISIEISTY